MIDFSKITQTLDGFKAYHVNKRLDESEVIHEFAIVHPRFGASIEYYNEKGNRVTYDAGKFLWVELGDSKFAIVKPKKKIDVTGWVTSTKGEVSGQYYLHVHDNKEDLPQGCLEPQQHTFTFEVDE